MTDPKAEQLVDALSRLLQPQLAKSPELRDVVAALGDWLIQEAKRAGATTQNLSQSNASPTAQPTSQSISQPVAQDQAATPIPPGPHSPARVIAPAAAIRGPVQVVSSATVPLKIGDTLVHVPVEGTTQEIGRARQSALETLARAEAPASTERTPIDLALMVKRSKLKAESCRLYIQRRAVASIIDDAELKRQMDEQIATAKATPNCFLWVFWRERTQPDDASLRKIALCYDALAAAADLARRRDELYAGRRSDDEPVILGLLAEASSALRVALKDSWLSDDDRDQAESHVWLRQETAQRRIFISRHMAIDDPADPLAAQSMIDRAAEVRTRLEDQAGKVKSIKNLLGQVRYHANQIVKAGGVECEPHWRKITVAIKSLQELGVPATDDRISEHLGAQAAGMIAQETPEDLREQLATVIDAALTERDDDDSDDTSEQRAPSERVLKVRSWLKGRRLVLIGGEPRPRAIQKLISAFELADVDWVFLTEHGSGASMRGPIERPDTAGVVVIIKLTGHLHADEARDYASRADKPLVLLKSGYNAEQIAHAFVEQVSDRFIAPVAAQ